MLGSHWRKTLFSSLSNFQAELCTLVMLVAHSEENMDQPTFLFIVTLIDFRQPSPGHRIVSVPMMMMRGWHQIGINCILILKYQFEREVLPRPPKLKVCFHWKPHHCWPFDPLAVSQQEHLCVCGRKNKQKAFTKFRRPSDSVSQQGGWEGVTCVSTTSESSFVFENEQKSLLLLPSSSHWRWPTLFHWHLVLAHSNVDFSSLPRISWKSDLCSTEIGFFWEENLLVQSHKSSAFEVADGVCMAARGLLAVSAFLGDRRRLRREPTTRLAEAGPCPQCADYGVLIISEYGNNKKFNWSLSPIQLIPNPEPC